MFDDDLMSKAYEIHEKAVELRTKEILAQHHLATGKDGGGGNSPELQAQARAEAEQEFAGIPDYLKTFAGTPEPSFFQSGIDSMHGAIGGISPGHVGNPINPGDTYPTKVDIARLQSGATELASWSGDAAWEFSRNYLQPLGGVSQNLFYVGYTLQAALQATQAMWQQARNVITQILDMTIASLENLLDGWPTSNDWSIDFTILAAVASVVAPVVGEAAGVATEVAITAVSASESVLSGVQPPAEKEPFNGRVAVDVIRMMSEMLTRVQQDVGATDDKISWALWHTVHEVMHADRGDFYLPKRPELGQSTPGNVRDGQHMGHPK